MAPTCTTKAIVPLSVSQINRQIRLWLEQDIGEVSVVGELSNLSKPASGHFYFTLKDQSAQLRCVFFRNYHQADAHQFKDGQQAIARGKLSLYEARGDYQLIVNELTPYGLGELYRQFELLKAKLEKAGYFAPERKKTIPRFPATIGVITSASGAALHDILTTLNRRYPLATVLVYPSEVQGQTASGQLIKALQRANQDMRCEVIILARGGGSIEDLWAFNDEKLALTIAGSQIPIVTGVGHETDFTIADFVSDYRAATPTAAAEYVTPHQDVLHKRLNEASTRLLQAVSRQLAQHQRHLSHLIAKISSPRQLINRHWQALDYLQRQLLQNAHFLCQRRAHRLNMTITKLEANNPTLLIHQSRARLQQLHSRLTGIMASHLAGIKQHFNQRLATLHAVSPLATLNRGYAIAMHDNKVLYNSNQAAIGETVDVTLAQGRLMCTVIGRMD